MSNEEAKMMLRTMQGLITIACEDVSSPMITKTAEAVDIAIAAIDVQDMRMQIEEKKEE